MKRLELLEASDSRVEGIWRRLEARTYFLSWGWIETWLAMLPPAHVPVLAVITEAGAPIAAAFIGRRRVLRHHVLPSRTLFLNTTGVVRFDELCLEHNGVVGDPAALPDLLELLPRDWDEIVLVAMDEVPVLHGSWMRIDREESAPFVDLARVRACPGGYLGVLAANTRAQLRRARREVGELEVEIAQDVPHALLIFDELVMLHTASWRARGEPGAFAEPWFEAFHRRLIATRLAFGEIELVRVRAGGITLGCLYNFVYGGRVTFYQSGVSRLGDPHAKPGLLCHAAAIAHAAACGHAVYDFLGGDTQYKRSLATDAARLRWVRIQRPLTRFLIEDRLRTWKHALQPR